MIWSWLFECGERLQNTTTFFFFFFFFLKGQFIFCLDFFLVFFFNKKNTPALPALSLNLKSKATYQELDCNLLLIEG